MRKNDHAITLIALIITIIIMLILAGVAISSVYNDGIINKTEKAAEKYNSVVQEEEQAMKKYKEDEDDEVIVRPPRVDENGLAISNYNRGIITIPKGFGVAELNENGEATGVKLAEEWPEFLIQENVDKGVVIVDVLGNEFVWIQIDSVPAEILVGGTRI